MESLRHDLEKGYAVEGESLIIGAPLYEESCLNQVFVKIPLKTMNRHGLIAGATGTGKTKTVQLLVEQLSDQGVPCFVMDIKGDLSGLAEKGKHNKKINDRQKRIERPYKPSAFPVELLSFSKELGIPVRATVSEFGPVLFSKMLRLNETQSGVMALAFKFCDDQGLPLVDLLDLRKVLQFLNKEGRKEVEKDYGRLPSQTVSAILRRIIQLEQQGAELFFGEPSFAVTDLIRRDHKGKGIISILRLTDIQDRPNLFSSFMQALLAEIYTTFPEIGDFEKPKLCLFFDEAHLLFENSSKELLEQLEQIVRLIRSKGVGLYFCTQSPKDIPEGVLGQLGLKIQHALRAFTPKDRKAIKLAAQNYPESAYYNTEELLTSLGIGEPLVTALGENGRPTPLVATLLQAPRSSMDSVAPALLKKIANQSILLHQYEKKIDRKTAREILADRIDKIVEQQKGKKRSIRSPMQKGIDNFISQMGRTFAREVSRILLGMIRR